MEQAWTCRYAKIKKKRFSFRNETKMKKKRKPKKTVSKKSC